MPGPGRYEIKSQFRRSPSADGTGQNEDEGDDELEETQEPAPFGSREKVFCIYSTHVCDQLQLFSSMLNTNVISASFLH